MTNSEYYEKFVEKLKQRWSLVYDLIMYSDHYMVREVHARVNFITSYVDELDENLISEQQDYKMTRADLNYVRDYFKTKFALEMVNDMMYVMSHNDEVFARLQNIANMK